MDGRQEAKLIGNSGLVTFLDKNVLAFDTDIAMMEAYNKMKTDAALAVKAASDSVADNTGFSADKLTAKNVASAQTSVLCGSAQVKLDMIGNQTLSNALHAGKNYYFKTADAISGSRMLDAYDVMNTNVVLLTVDYVSPLQLTDLNTKILNFTTMSGTTTYINKVSPILTKLLATSLKITSVDIISLRKIGAKYKLLNPQFFNSLVAASKIPPVAVRHNVLTFLMIDSITKAVLLKVNSTLSVSKETPSSDAQGAIVYSPVKVGKAIATFNVDGYIPQSFDAVVTKGKTNYTIQLVALMAQPTPTPPTV